MKRHTSVTPMIEKSLCLLRLVLNLYEYKGLGTPFWITGGASDPGTGSVISVVGSLTLCGTSESVAQSQYLPLLDWHLATPMVEGKMAYGSRMLKAASS